MAKDLSAVIIKDLKTRTIGRKVFYLPRVASTMDIARQEALKGAAEGTIVITGEQTGGRGRFTRSWIAPEGNVALSESRHP